ncbi:hypothetical protein [Methylotetracoccus oryzae]|uniref:hypothetical protein n=1 Tax=Methylotetracoccus oryzae TaxID=1919059 RepID=UPI00111ADF90|nr:hypothetical protein [Methylotetracoccus oryzae]
MKADGRHYSEQLSEMPPTTARWRRDYRRNRSPRGIRAGAFLSCGALALALALAGCASETVRYKLVPPPGAAGEACVAKCDEQRKSCNESLQNEFEVCQTQYREDMSIYTRCRNSSLGPAPGSQFSCNTPRPCPLPRGESCDEAYRACFQACGGKVEEEPSS